MDVTRSKHEDEVLTQTSSVVRTLKNKNNKSVSEYHQ